MIEVSIQCHADKVMNFIISGHASYGSEMMDVVCAEVSAISVGGLNAIDMMCPNQCAIEMRSGYVAIHVNESSEILETILKTIEIQLNTVEHTNYEYIKITKVEV